MAFPVPAHLPRKKDPQDVSTAILTKVSEATTKSLNAQLAASWVAELDDTIRQTRERIHERIQRDLPAFEQQWSSSTSIQERLQTLSSNVDQLSHNLSGPETGLIPTLISHLTWHAALAQDVLNAEVKHKALSYLLKCRDKFQNATSFVQSGKLPEAMNACDDLECILESPPSPVDRAEVISDMKRSYRALRARTEEQLTDAYSRSVTVSSSELAIRDAVQVRQSDTILPLSSILLSLPPPSLSTHLSTLRRDLTSHYVDFIMKQPTSVSVTTDKDVTGTPEHKLSIFPAPPDSEPLSSRLDNLSLVLKFLDTHLFPNLPASEQKGFPVSLCKPVWSAVLSNLLVPSLPSSPDALPAFLDLTNQAVEFEGAFVVDILGGNAQERDIKTWVEAIGLHYERKRRVEILDHARAIILRTDNGRGTFSVEIDVTLDTTEAREQEPTSSSVSTSFKPTIPAPVPDPPVQDDGPDAWGFDDGPSQEATEDPADGDGWGFDDDIEPEGEPEQQQLEPQPEERTSRPSGQAPESGDVDPSDAWGWDAETSSPTLAGDETTDTSVWDDPWDEQPSKPVKISAVPKPAKRLEKLSAKGSSMKLRQESTSSASCAPAPTSPTPAKPHTPATPQLVPPPPPARMKETYVVSGFTKELLQLVEAILQEGANLASSGVLSAYSPASSPSGSIISQSAPLVLDLFRALYPVAHQPDFDASPKRSMRFSNDCLYLGNELKGIVAKTNMNIPVIIIKLQDGVERLKLVGNSWFDETIDRQCRHIDEILDKAEGFVDTTDQDRFDECEAAVSQVLQHIRRLANDWKSVLNKSKYYVAIGAAADAALSRILRDILAIPDITEAESHRLSELCRIMNALEGLFVEDPNQPSFVVPYVPSWLKFSYLSELLEASIADISYLFEEGALVDFEIDELVKLVRALFADTPLRTNTINKFLRGHPAPS
ncbi:hypothetical protein OBBRIDRAFT_886899 [Obba rivulosa]|uniref:Retrograde transport protein Dsl1 C-terminal domain-containing protein n=1 Tax=Obba rivulosa TaxID=1052685 RepID=A0A8E2AUX2_9APHY|nr:hypothetical protein OBBRIDRAFT_886899 [Obba rivulosa]